MDEMKPAETTADEQTQSPFALQGVIDVKEEKPQPPAKFGDLGMLAFLALAWCVTLALVILVAWIVRRLARHKG